MIQRRKPLQRSLKPLRRVPIMRVSKKRQKEYNRYMKLRAEYLAAHPYCEAFGVIWPGSEPLPPATEIHHTIDRRAHFLDVSSWRAVCREAHEFIHSHPGQARKLGLLK